MGTHTGISWADATWNPWQGCRPVSAGCEHCYMYRDKRRLHQDPTVVVRSSAPTFALPRRLKEPSIVFVCSWSDFFIPDADPWRPEAWDVMRANPRHLYLLLTKRVEAIPERLPTGWPWPNVVLGVTVEGDAYRWRVDLLLRIPAYGRFISYEPAIAPLSLRADWVTCPACGGDPDVDDCPACGGSGFDPAIHWLIAGGETGPDGARRPMRLAWAEDLYAQCRAAGVAFFGKQAGGERPGVPLLIAGREIKEWPAIVHAWREAHQVPRDPS